METEKRPEKRPFPLNKDYLLVCLLLHSSQAHNFRVARKSRQRQVFRAEQACFEDSKHVEVTGKRSIAHQMISFLTNAHYNLWNKPMECDA
jgi:hypothetical protein